jgi:HEAT repeat protein
VAFEALADAGKLEPSLAERLIQDFEDRLRAGNCDEDSLRAFAAVAADQRPRGRVVFAFLQQELASDDNEQARTAAAQALSLSNLPQAAEVLGEHYDKSADLRSALLRMGELAVPVLATRANNGDRDAIADLADIGTPAAARALVPLLWSDPGPVSLATAFNLMGIFADHEVEQALRDFPLSAQQCEAEWLDWVWEPFGEPEGSALPVIAGRIGWVIRETDKQGAKARPWLDGIRVLEIPS